MADLLLTEKTDSETLERIELIGQLDDRCEAVLRSPVRCFETIKALILDLECVGLHKRAREIRALLPISMWER